MFCAVQLGSCTAQDACPYFRPYEGHGQVAEAIISSPPLFLHLCLQIQVATKAGKYAVSKPSTAYKSLFQHLAEASEVAAVCHAALVASSGGSPEASLSEVVAKLSRAKARQMLLNLFCTSGTSTISRNDHGKG